MFRFTTLFPATQTEETETHPRTSPPRPSAELLEKQEPRTPGQAEEGNRRSQNHLPQGAAPVRCRSPRKEQSHA